MKIIRWLWPDGIIGDWFQPKELAVRVFVIALIALPPVGLFMGFYTDNPAWFLLCLSLAILGAG